MLRSVTNACPRQTAASSSLRDNTTPACEASWYSSSNSCGVTDYVPPADADGVADGIELHVVHGHRAAGRRARLCLRPVNAPSQRRDSRRELEDAERLGDVVVGAAFEAEHLVRFA